jgi:hypothetical protein
VYPGPQAPTKLAFAFSPALSQLFGTRDIVIMVNHVGVHAIK